MATYKELQQYIKANFGYIPKSCWIAHTEEICDLSPKIANNRININKRVCPCPANKHEDIIKALRHFKMI